MPRVPVYDTPTVEANTQPAVATQAPQSRNYAIEQGAQQIQAVQQANDVAGKMMADSANKANQLRVDEALNEAKMTSLKLTYDKDVGFTQTRGKDALERQSGKPLADEYTETFDKELQRISGGLGNDLQRQAFTMRANELRASIYGGAVKHEAEQGKVWADSTDESSIKRLQADIALRFAEPGAVDQTINGYTDKNGVPVKGIKQYVNDLAKRNGRPPEWADEKTAEIVADTHGEIVQRMMDKSPTAAQKYMNDHLAELGKHVVPLQRTLRVAVDREQGNAKAEVVFAGSAPFGTTFDSIANRVLKIEGGYVADDAGKGETNLGINKTANPDVDIKGLTPEKAKALYKERYWNAIGGDSLAPEMRAVAFDAAVNHGPSKANKMLAEANGSPEKFIELRKAEYARLIAADPEKYGKYAKSWDSRLNQLSASLKGERSLSGMLAETEAIEDPEQRKIATTRVSQLYQLEKAAKQEEYDNNFKAAQEIAYKKPGGWSDVSHASWAALSQKDREVLRAGLPKQSDPNTKLMLQENPDLWKAGQIEKYRPLLSESDYQHFHTKANGPQAEQKLLQAKIDNEQFADGLARAGLDKLLHPKAGTQDEKDRIDLKAKFEQVIEAEQQAKGKTLNIDEKNALLTRLLKPVKVNMVRTGSWFGWNDGPATPEEMRAYQVKNPQNINIPNASRTAIVADFEKRGIKATPDRILNAYLASKETQ